MISLHTLLSRYRFQPTARLARERAAQIITEVSGVEVGEGEVAIKQNILFLHTSAIKKHEILLKKEALQVRLTQDPLTRSVSRIS